MTLRKKNVVEKVTECDGDDDEKSRNRHKRREFSQPNSYQMMCSHSRLLLFSCFLNFSRLSSPRLFLLSLSLSLSTPISRTHFQFHILSAERKIENVRSAVNDVCINNTVR